MADSPTCNEATCVYVVHGDKTDRIVMSGLLAASRHRVKCFPKAQLFLGEVESASAGCVLLDIDRTTADHLEVLRELTARQSPLAVVAVSEQAMISKAVKAMKLGALDVIEKPQWAATLIQAVEVSLAVSSQRSDVRIQAIRSRRRLDLLTQREREVLTEILEGRSSKVAAYQLGVSARTIDIHRGNIMKKLGAKSVADAMSLQFWAEQLQSGNPRLDLS